MKIKLDRKCSKILKKVLFSGCNDIYRIKSVLKDYSTLMQLSPNTLHKLLKDTF
jgi:hypothetical protein